MTARIVCRLCGEANPERRYVSRTQYVCLERHVVGVHEWPDGMQMPEYQECAAVNEDPVAKQQLHEEQIQRVTSSGGEAVFCACGYVAIIACTRCGKRVCDLSGACAHRVDGAWICVACKRDVEAERAAHERERAERERREADEREQRHREAYDRLPALTVDELAAWISDRSRAVVDGQTHRLDRLTLQDKIAAVARVHGAVDVGWRIPGGGYTWVVITARGRLVERVLPLRGPSTPVTECPGSDRGRFAVTLDRLREARPFAELERAARAELRPAAPVEFPRRAPSRSSASWQTRMTVLVFLLLVVVVVVGVAVSL